MNIKRLLHQKAVYWPPEGTDGGGNQIYGPPVQIQCRWEDRNELYLHPKTGEEKVARSIVYMLDDLLPDGVLMRGGMEDILSLDVPKDNPNAFDIQRFDKVPDKKNRDKRTLRTAYL